MKAQRFHFYFQWSNCILKDQLSGSYVYLTNVYKNQTGNGSLYKKATTYLAVKWNKLGDTTIQLPRCFLYTGR